MPLTLRHGDIAAAQTDAIVNAWNRNFIPYWLLVPQGVAKSLRRAAGKKPFREVSTKGLLPLGAAVATGAGDLQARYIIHAAALHAYWSASERSVRIAAKNTFACAQHLGVDSIAFPLLGAGTGRLEPERSLKIIEVAWAQSAGHIDTEIWVDDRETYQRLQLHRSSH